MQNEGGHSGPNSLPPLPFPSLSQGHEPAHEPGLGGGSRGAGEESRCVQARGRGGVAGAAVGRGHSRREARDRGAVATKGGRGSGGGVVRDGCVDVGCSGDGKWAAMPHEAQARPGLRGGLAAPPEGCAGRGRGGGRGAQDRGQGHPQARRSRPAPKVLPRRSLTLGCPVAPTGCPTEAPAAPPPRPHFAAPSQCWLRWARSLCRCHGRPGSHPHRHRPPGVWQCERGEFD